MRLRVGQQTAPLDIPVGGRANLRFINGLGDIYFE